MPWLDVLWTEGPEGNAEHIAADGIEREEAEHVLRNPVDDDVSRSTGYPIVFGRTRSGRALAVVFDWIDDVTVHPITAFDLEG